jgi:hypothetical protein
VKKTSPCEKKTTMLEKSNNNKKIETTTPT